ncbi:MAG: hypothetical protein GX851_08455 [Clostridiales bacterium]|nr:hypothetical protein [Clostridiales bacterium]
MLKRITAKRFFAMLMTLVLLSCAVAPSASALQKEYTITNPYASVNWGSTGAYKANLHTHTTFSDGQMLLPDVVERYYELGYDILSITDHGVIGRAWDKEPEMVPIIGYYAFIEKTATLTTERYQEILNGTDRGGRGMFNLQQGIELNALVIEKNHINGFFAEYGQNYLGVENDFETSVAANAKAGGITHLNHLGDWTGAGGNADKNRDPATVKLFSDLFIKYPSCVGMEIINRIDSVTRHDRILWDEILQEVVPYGRNVFAFSNDDSHVYDDIGLSFEVLMLDEVNNDTIRQSMEQGSFFAVGRRARAELGNDFFGGYDTPYPMATDIIVNEAADTITVAAENYNKIQWIADGKIICEGNTIDLNNYENDISSYVRFQISGDGGMCFSQPFVVDDGTLGDANPPIVEADTESIFAKLMAVITAILNTRIVAIIKKLG